MQVQSEGLEPSFFKYSDGKWSIDCAFSRLSDAKQAFEDLNGFQVANRAMRVGLGNDRFTPDSTKTLLRKFGQP